jgi:hypothetical protein
VSLHIKINAFEVHRDDQERNMKKAATFCVTILIFASIALSQDQPSAPERAPLLLVQQIPLPNVGGRIDHFTFDGKRT